MCIRDRLSYVHQLIEDIGASAYSQQLIGIIVGERVHKRGLMVDGRTYEDALGRGGDENSAEPEPEPLMENLQTRNEQELMDKCGLLKEGRGPLHCEACGRSYASVEDANETFIKHDGCPGCHQKAKWG